MADYIPAHSVEIPANYGLEGIDQNRVINDTIYWANLYEVQSPRYNHVSIPPMLNVINLNNLATYERTHPATYGNPVKLSSQTLATLPQNPNG